MYALYIAAGGFLGAILRYTLSIVILKSEFPLATLMANLLGSYFIGIILVFAYKRWALRPQYRLFFGVGLLGSFTTFSTYTLETLNFFNEGYLLYGLLYYLISPVLGVLFALLGVKTAWLFMYKGEVNE